MILDVKFVENIFLPIEYNFGMSRKSVRYTNICKTSSDDIF